MITSLLQMAMIFADSFIFSFTLKVAVTKKLWLLDYYII